MTPKDRRGELNRLYDMQEAIEILRPSQSMQRAGKLCTGTLTNVIYQYLAMFCRPFVEVVEPRRYASEVRGIGRTPVPGIPYLQAVTSMTCKSVCAAAVQVRIQRLHF